MARERKYAENYNKYRSKIILNRNRSVVAAECRPATGRYGLSWRRSSVCVSRYARFFCIAHNTNTWGRTIVSGRCV